MFLTTIFFFLNLMLFNSYEKQSTSVCLFFFAKNYISSIEFDNSLQHMSNPAVNSIKFMLYIAQLFLREW
jgi:hypothetical protein